MNWCDPHYNAPWKDMENYTTKNIPVQAILADNNLRQYIDTLEDPWTKLTLNVWASVIK